MEDGTWSSLCTVFPAGSAEGKRKRATSAKGMQSAVELETT